MENFPGHSISAMIEKHNFSGMRILGTHIYSVKWKLEFMLQTFNDGSPEQVNESVIGYHKIKFWLDSVLDDVIFTQFDDELGLNLTYSADNVSVHLPSIPVDSHIAQILHAKLNAICGDHCSIGEVSLSASDTTATHIFDTAGKYTLPGADYMDDNINSSPWWERPCFETADFTKTEVQEDEELSEYLACEDPLVLLEKKLRSEMSEPEQDAEPATIIKMTKKWTPKLV